MPRTLEELIPPEDRERFVITTSTRIIRYGLPSLEDAEREIPEANTIELRYRDGRMDNRIREYMKQQRIVTVHKMDGNLQKLRQWAVGRGKKIRLIQETA